MAPVTLPPGFRFHPTDEELVAYYLDRKINGRSIELDIIPEIDLYKCEPWELPDKSFLPSKDMEWYFYSPRDRKYPNGSRTNRATRGGYWKATGKDRTIHSQKRGVGMKKTLVYYKGRAPHGVRTNWVMHEYRLLYSQLDNATLSSSMKDSYALCRIIKKTTQIPKSIEGKESVVDAEGAVWQMADQRDMQVDDGEGPESSRGGMESNEDGDSFDHFLHEYNPKIFSSENSSSDLTQGNNVADDLPTPVASDNEANSAANNLIYPFPTDCPSNFMQIPSNFMNRQNLHYQHPYYPPLELENFPRLDIMGETKTLLKPECTIDKYMKFDEFRGSMNGTLEEIVALCTLPMQEDNNAILH